ERVRHLGRGEASEQPQGEGNLSRGGQGRVTARKDESQAVVLHGGVLLGFLWSEHLCGLLVPTLARSLAAEAVDRPVAGGRDDPSRRAGGQPGGWPSLHRLDKSVLNGFLGGANITEGANQHRHRPAVFLTEYTLDFGYRQLRHAYSAPS